jgi:DNA-directed RNA polymerase specialized sigma24 family protein
MHEIADVMGVTENAVKTAQARAFRRFRTVLGEGQVE